MSWHDKKSIEQILKLKELYGMQHFWETGTFKGVNMRLHSFHWREVHSCDISAENLKIAKSYLSDRRNISLWHMSSPDFLKRQIEIYGKDKGLFFIYLDAHFYTSIVEDRWVILKELEALAGFDRCVICIHDFDCSGLGHLCYDGEHMGFPLLLDSLRKVNPNFHFYINTKETCDIYDEGTIHEREELIVNEDVLDNVRFTQTSDRLRYRGILYCTPTELDLTIFNLRKA